MKPAPILHGADRSSSTRRCSSTLLLLAVTGLLNACGGGGGEPAAPQFPPSTCSTGPAPAVLIWDAVTGATGYRIYNYDPEAGTISQVKDVQDGLITTATVPGLSIGTTYYFTATAYDASNNESNFSNVACKTITSS